MKQKRFLCLLLAVLMLMPMNVFAAEDTEERWTRTEGNGSYVTIRVPAPEGENMIWSDYQKLSVRYSDTKEPVALASTYKSGYLFATVPAEDVNRPLEVFKGEPLEFEDCFVYWESNGKQEGFYDAPLGTDELNIRGIILGNGAEGLNPDQTITRAEAFTIICRLLSLDPEGVPGFADVSEDDWYYDTASAAKAAGITVEKEYFNPLRTVTRGEVTVMLARAMKTIGWMKDGTGSAADLDLADAEAIPDWALESYLAFNPYNVGIFSYQNTEELDEFGYIQEALARQEQDATRGEVIEMVYNAMRMIPVYPTQTAINWGFDTEMPAIDGSTSTLPYTNAVYNAMYSNYYNHPDLPKKHSKSYYSYDRLIDGEVDLLFISTKPTEDTIAKAKAAGVELELIPIAYDAMVFFTNGENAASNLTMEQIRNIYVDNAYTNWSELGGPDAGLIPYCRNADSGSQAQMEEFFLKGSEIHPDIKRENTAISMSSVLTDVWQAKTDDPLAYALGYSIYYYYQSASYIFLSDMSDLKLLSVNGVYPTDETIADGSYPLAGYNYAVVRADEPEDSIARRMVEFMLSEQGQQCVLNAGFGALK